MKPLTEKEKAFYSRSQREQILYQLGDLESDLRFLQDDLRFKWEKKKIIDKIGEIQHFINQLK
jgi:hypothetical protein